MRMKKLSFENFILGDGDDHSGYRWLRQGAGGRRRTGSASASANCSGRGRHSIPGGTPRPISAGYGDGFVGASELVTTGVVMPDISRSVPVITLASGRVVDIRARLGDTVKKDQVLLRVRSELMLVWALTRTAKPFRMNSSRADIQAHQGPLRTRRNGPTGSRSRH